MIKKAALVAMMFLMPCSMAYAQMEDVVEQAFCARNPMMTMGNVDTLVKQKLISEEAAGDAALKAFRRCIPWAFSYDLRVTRIFAWNHNDFELPIGDVYRVKYPNGAINAMVFVHPMGRFEYLLEKARENVSANRNPELIRMLSDKSLVTKPFCLQDSVLGYLFAGPAANADDILFRNIDLALKHGADVDEPYLDKGFDIPSSAIEGLKMQHGILAYSFGSKDAIFFGDRAFENRCEQFSVPTSNPEYRTLLDHAMSAQPILEDRVIALLKRGAIARPDQLHTFFGPWGWPVHFSSYYPKNKIMFEALLKAGADINARDQNGQTILGRLLRQPMAPDDLAYLTSKGAKP